MVKPFVYAGIGSRETPSEICALMELMGDELAKLGGVLRSGAAYGADQAFERGCDLAGGAKEIYLPWAGYNNHASHFTGPTMDAQELASKVIPHWNSIHRRGVKLLLSRNMHQVMGWDLNQPCDFIICWTKDGKDLGGTAYALMAARLFDIPIFNLGSMSLMDVAHNIERTITK